MVLSSAFANLIVTRRVGSTRINISVRDRFAQLTAYGRGWLIVDTKRNFSHSTRLFSLLSLTMLFALSAIADEQFTWAITTLGTPINTVHQEGFPAITKDGLALYFAREISAVDGVCLWPFCVLRSDAKY